MNHDFYLNFENTFRGSREQIKQRLQVYLPLTAALRESMADGRAVDLGCGRGEWLELLSGQGWQAGGVDSSPAMLQVCRDLRLPAEEGEAISFLQKLAADSLSLLTGFHLIEHLEFEAQRALLHEAQRVLQPGGLLILETPNPENLLVATCGFYTDPTHRRPIPPDLLDFLAGEANFQERCLLRLNSGKTREQQEPGVPGRVARLFSEYPDYSLIARKDSASALVPLAELAADLGLPVAAASQGLEERLAEIDWQHNVALQEKELKVHALEVELQGKNFKEHALQSELHEKNLENQTLKAEQNGKVFEIQTLRIELNEKNLRIHLLETELGEKNLGLHTLEAALGEKDLQSQALEAALGEKNVAATALEAALGEKNAALQALEAALAEKNTAVAALEAALAEKAAATAALAAEQHEKDAAAAALAAELAAMRRSRSWRVTAPLRRCIRAWHSLSGGSPPPPPAEVRPEAGAPAAQGDEAPLSATARRLLRDLKEFERRKDDPS